MGACSRSSTESPGMMRMVYVAEMLARSDAFGCKTCCWIRNIFCEGSRIAERNYVRLSMRLLKCMSELTLPSFVHDGIGCNHGGQVFIDNFKSDRDSRISAFMFLFSVCGLFVP